MMLLHSLRSTHAGRPPIDSDRDDWYKRARCAGPDKDAWSSDKYAIRARAAHECVEHCPVLERCRADAVGMDWRVITVAGVIYDHCGVVQAVDGFPDCDACAPPRPLRVRPPVVPKTWVLTCSICGAEFIGRSPLTLVCKDPDCRRVYDRDRKSTYRAQLSTDSSTRGVAGL